VAPKGRPRNAAKITLGGRGGWRRVCVSTLTKTTAAQPPRQSRSTLLHKQHSKKGEAAGREAGQERENIRRKALASRGLLVGLARRLLCLALASTSKIRRWSRPAHARIVRWRVSSKQSHCSSKAQDTHSRGRGKEESQQQNHNVKGNTCEGGRGRSEGRVIGQDASTARPRPTWKGKGRRMMID